MKNKRYQIIRTDRTPEEERERKNLRAKRIYERYSVASQETSQEDSGSSLSSRLLEGEETAINSQCSNFSR